MARRPRILYLTHVDWGWIKQRPHFLAEELTNYFDVHVAYPSRAFLDVAPHSVAPGLTFTRLPDFPLRRKSRMSCWANHLLVTRLLRKLFETVSPDLVWLSFPDLIHSLPENCSVPIVYDCMDALPEFSVREWHRRLVFDSEALTVGRAEMVFASSAWLCDLLMSRYRPRNEVQLLRNAFGGSVLPEAQTEYPQEVTARGEKRRIRFCYFGTVAAWFDIETVLATLRDFPELEYHVIGPREASTSQWNHPRLFFHSAVPHAQLPSMTAIYDVLVMPFVLNDITRAVDPVKLYEYINLGKPIVTIRYEEIERFAPFVDFYDGLDDLRRIIKSFIEEGPRRRYTDAQRIDFLSKNSWRYRVEEVSESLLELSGVG